jgi:hypothetical protein
MLHVNDELRMMSVHFLWLVNQGTSERRKKEYGSLAETYKRLVKKLATL